jgi:hypothetical protein
MDLNWITQSNPAFTDKPGEKTFPAELIWAAAAYAQRINGSYLKEPVMNDEPVPAIMKQTSATVMRDALANPSLLTEEDYNLGRNARQWLTKRVTFKQLTNKVNDFDRVVTDAVQIEEFNAERDKYYRNVIASQIQAYQHGLRLDKAQSRMRNDVESLGQIGEKIESVAEIVTAIYSRNYHVYFMNAITDNDQMIFFSFRERLLPGEKHRIRGTIKAIKPDVTQLSRVKLLD